MPFVAVCEVSGPSSSNVKDHGLCRCLNRVTELRFHSDLCDKRLAKESCEFQQSLLNVSLTMTVNDVNQPSSFYLFLHVSTPHAFVHSRLHLPKFETSGGQRFLPLLFSSLHDCIMSHHSLGHRPKGETMSGLNDV